MQRTFYRPSFEILTSLNENGRVRNWLLAATGVIACTLAAGYHTLSLQEPDPGGTVGTVVYHSLVLFGYLIVYLFLSERFRKRPASSLRVFWSPLIAGVSYVLLHWFVTRFGRPPELQGIASEALALGFEYGTGRPLVPATVVKMNLLALGGAVFAFILLLRFRDLVLVKRTRSSQRNWYLMLGFMVLASVLTFMKPASAELTVWQRMAMIPAVGFMVVNSLRLSWIVFLPFVEKIVSIGLALLLLIILAGIGIMEDSVVANAFQLPASYTFMKHYSYPLSVFVSLSIVFGILYCTTAFLSLLFHLPTTSDFQQKAGELAAMHSLTHLVGQVFDPDRLYSTIAASPVEAGAGEAAWLATRDRSSTTLRPLIVGTCNITAEEVNQSVDVAAIYDEVQDRREEVLLAQAPADHRVLVRPGEGIGSLLAVPLVTRNELLGVLFVTKEVSHGFEHDDVEAISVFAAQAALAIDNARLFEERVEKERLTRELAIAREVQRKLLPQRLPLLDGLSITASSIPALEVGGDYYDFLQVDEDRLAFIVADVSGKGTSAAFYMAEMQGIFRSLGRLAVGPCEFLQHANAALSGTLERSVFISGIYGVIDSRKETITLSRAGHCPAVKIGVDGLPMLMRTSGMGLGLDSGSLFATALSEEVVTLQPGDVFVLYTDGVIESRGQDGREYGYERLLKALSANRHEDAHNLHNALSQDLQSFVGKRQYDDDMTLVVMKWHGKGVPLETLSPGYSHSGIPEA